MIRRWFGPIAAAGVSVVIVNVHDGSALKVTAKSVPATSADPAAVTPSASKS